MFPFFYLAIYFLPRPAAIVFSGITDSEINSIPVRLCEFSSKELVLTVGYISLTTAIHKDSTFLAELKERSKRIYEMLQFIFYAIGYVLERILSIRRSGIGDFLPPKVRSQQLTLFEYIKIADCGTYGLKK